MRLYPVVEAGIELKTSACRAMARTITALLVSPIQIGGMGFCMAGNCPYGMGLGANAGGTVFLSSDGSQGQTLYTVNPGTGAITPGPMMTGGQMNGGLAALAFGSGTLFGIELVSPGGGAGSPGSSLVSINTTTGAITTIGGTGTNIDALTSTSP